MLEKIISLFLRPESLNLLIDFASLFAASFIILWVLLLLAKIMIVSIYNRRLVVKEYMFNETAEDLLRGGKGVVVVLVSNTCIIAACYLYQFFIEEYEELSYFSSLVLPACIVLAIIVNNIIDLIFNLNCAERKNRNDNRESNDSEVLEDLKCNRNSDTKNDIDTINSKLRFISSICVFLIFFMFSIYYKSEIYTQMAILMSGIILGVFIDFSTRKKDVLNRLQEFKGYWIYLIWAMAYIIAFCWMGISSGAFDIINAFNARCIVPFVCFVMLIAIYKTIDIFLH